MPDRQIRDEAVTLFLAGHETTANALAWSFYLLGRHPDVAARLAAESRAVLGGRSPTMDDLPRLPTALMVLKETMRLYPPAYMVGRQAERDVSIGTANLRRGDTIFVNIYAMHRRADILRVARRVPPERFAPEREKLLAARRLSAVRRRPAHLHRQPLRAHGGAAPPGRARPAPPLRPRRRARGRRARAAGHPAPQGRVWRCASNESDTGVTFRIDIRVRSPI